MKFSPAKNIQTRSVAPKSSLLITHRLNYEQIRQCRWWFTSVSSLHLFTMDWRWARFSNPVLDSWYLTWQSASPSPRHIFQNTCIQRRATSGLSIKSQVLDLKTLPVFSPLKISVKRKLEEQIEPKICAGDQWNCRVYCLFIIYPNIC